MMRLRQVKSCDDGLSTYYNCLILSLSEVGNHDNIEFQAVLLERSSINENLAA